MLLTCFTLVLQDLKFKSHYCVLTYLNFNSIVSSSLCIAVFCGILQKSKGSVTPGRRFSTRKLKSALDESASSTSSPSTISQRSRGPTPQAVLRARGNFGTPQGGLNRLRRWAKGKTPLGRTPKKRLGRKGDSELHLHDAEDVENQAVSWLTKAPGDRVLFVIECFYLVVA